MINCKVKQDPFIIIGGDAQGEDVSGEIRAELLRLQLHFKEVEGHYTYKNTGQHITEQSFMVITPNKLAVRAVIQLALRYKQESVLAVDAIRKSRLIYLDPLQRQVDLGKFVALTKREFKRAKPTEYTYDGRYYYICEQ